MKSDSSSSYSQIIMDGYELKLNSCPLPLTMFGAEINTGLPTYDGSKVLTAVITRSRIFWFVSLCS